MTDTVEITVASVDQANAVIAQLPPEARSRTSGITASPQPDGSVVLRVPPAFAAAAQAADPNAPLPPFVKTVFTYREFEGLFAPGERSAIWTAATQNAVLLGWLLRASAGPIDLTDPEAKTGLDLLVTAGVITADRETAVLAGQAPTN